MKLQILYNEFKNAERKYNELDEAFNLDFTNEEAENELDQYYEKVYYPAFVELVNEVVELTKLSFNQARHLIESEMFEELMSNTII